MKRTIITKEIAVEFDLPRQWYCRTGDPGRYIKMRCEALERYYGVAPYHTITHDNRDVLRVLVPVRHTYPKPAWRICSTAFHGGGILSEHYTRDAAKRSLAKHIIGDCVCGCCGILEPGRSPRSRSDNDNMYHDPYALVD